MKTDFKQRNLNSEVIPTGAKNEYVGKIDDLKYQKKEKVTVKPTGSNDLLTVKLRYKAPVSYTHLDVYKRRLVCSPIVS